ncbi:hypothetical protein VTH06DRAFT_6223 [Thermothelomyces fergusii]
MLFRAGYHGTRSLLKHYSCSPWQRIQFHGAFVVIGIFSRPGVLLSSWTHQPPETLPATFPSDRFHAPSCPTWLADPCDSETLPRLFWGQPGDGNFSGDDHDSLDGADDDSSSSSSSGSGDDDDDDPATASPRTTTTWVPSEPYDTSISQGDAILLSTMDCHRTTAGQWMGLLRRGASSQSGVAEAVDDGASVVSDAESLRESESASERGGDDDDGGEDEMDLDEP